MTADRSNLTLEADRAAAAGRLDEAERLLGAAAQSGGEPGLYLRLAGVQRANGRPKAALESVHRAMAFSPRDFTALLMRASLLERLGSPEAGRAWALALVQRPRGELPPSLAEVVRQAEDRARAWTRAREKRLAGVVADTEAKADEDERGRIARFRSNILRQTQHYSSQPSQFHYPGLRELEFHPRPLFPWIERLEAAVDVVLAEFQAVMAAERAELIPYVDYADHLPLDQWKDLNRSREWSAIHLIRNGNHIEANAIHCSRTLDLLKAIGQPFIPGACPNAMFSLLAPNTRIPPHNGVNNARLICHLPLIVPDGCWFRVGAQVRQWRKGEAFVFDDTIEHEASNPSSELRAVLIFDVWHPDLSALERSAVAAMVASELAGEGDGQAPPESEGLHRRRAQSASHASRKKISPGFRSLPARR